MRSVINVLAVIFISSGCLVAKGADNNGHYEGEVVASWEEDGRQMRLRENFYYIDPMGEVWEAPSGSIVDGASIPSFAWSIIGGPFEGKYRNASVIHDVACVTKERTWAATHLAFYNAMLASGVSRTKAKIMYAAVYHGGPRWREPLRRVRARDQYLRRKATPEPKVEVYEAGRMHVYDYSYTRAADLCPPGLRCAPPEPVDVYVSTEPSSSSITTGAPDGFEALRKRIERYDISIKEIASYPIDR